MRFKVAAPPKITVDTDGRAEIEIVLDPPGTQLLHDIASTWPGKPRSIRRIEIGRDGRLFIDTMAEDIDDILTWLVDPIDWGVTALGAMGDEYDKRIERMGDQQADAQRAADRWFQDVSRHQR